MNSIFRVIAIVGCLIGSSARAEDALSLMTFVFRGDHSRVFIETTVKEVLSTYDVPVSEETMMQVADVSVMLREKTNVDEIKILQCVAKAGPGVAQDWRESALMCAMIIKSQ